MGVEGSLAVQWSLPQYTDAGYLGHGADGAVDAKLSDASITARIMILGIGESYDHPVCLQDTNKDGICTISESEDDVGLRRAAVNSGGSASARVDISEMYSKMFVIRKRATCGDSPVDAGCAAGYIARAGAANVECEGHVCDPSGVDSETCCMHACSFTIYVHVHSRVLV